MAVLVLVPKLFGQSAGYLLNSFNHTDYKVNARAEVTGWGIFYFGGLIVPQYMWAWQGSLCPNTSVGNMASASGASGEPFATLSAISTVLSTGLPRNMKIGHIYWYGSGPTLVDEDYEWACTYDPVGGGGTGECNGQEPDICDQGYAWSFSTCQCEPGSPVLIDVLGNGFSMTNSENGVNFDLNSDGVIEHVSWTALASDDAWLSLDNNGNSRIDNGTELFGNFTAQPHPPAGQERNGFLALAVFDRPMNGGNNDGRITAADAVFGSLRLWQDVNHNGLSEPNELRPLAYHGLALIDLDYERSRRVDQYGNQFKYRARIRDNQGAQAGRWAWDVFLVTQQ